MIRSGRAWLWVAGAWILAGIFIWSGAVKLPNPRALAQAVEHYQLLPWWGAKLLGVLLPAWEIAAGLALLIPAWRRAGALVVLGLTIMFLAAILSALARGLNIPCGCFGSGTHPADAASLVFDLALAGLAGWVLFFHSPK